ncbi:MAG: hypothetical protein DBX52_05635 [Clostridiales bacterium]|nr:MAG: hypothetical protein DBX52_05635 [Clostridiales bacterium]
MTKPCPIEQKRREITAALYCRRGDSCGPLLKLPAVGIDAARRLSCTFFLAICLKKWYDRN